MSARDDYPADGAIGGTAELSGGMYERMCDEIDRLRIKVGADDRLFKAMEAPLDELVRELTAHADAMRELLRMHYLIATELDRLMEDDAQRIAVVVDAYDAFVKEC